MRKGARRRSELLWISFAASSFPVPASPVRVTGSEPPAAFSTNRRILAAAGLTPTISSGSGSNMVPSRPRLSSVSPQLESPEIPSLEYLARNLESDLRHLAHLLLGGAGQQAPRRLVKALPEGLELPRG